MFYLDDCSSPVEALEAVMAVVREVSEKKPTSEEFRGAIGPVCYGYVNNQPIDQAERLFRELEKVKPEDLLNCIRTKWVPFFNVEELFGVMTCPEDKVDDYEEELKDIGFAVKRVSFTELLQSGFDHTGSIQKRCVIESLRNASEECSPVC